VRGCRCFRQRDPENDRRPEPVSAERRPVIGSFGLGMALYFSPPRVRGACGGRCSPPSPLAHSARRRAAGHCWAVGPANPRPNGLPDASGASALFVFGRDQTPPRCRRHWVQGGGRFGPVDPGRKKALGRGAPAIALNKARRSHTIPGGEGCGAIPRSSLGALFPRSPRRRCRPAGHPPPQHGLFRPPGNTHDTRHLGLNFFF